MTHIFQNMFLTFLDRLIEGLNTRFDKYGSVVPKMHAFVPSVIAVGKKIKRLMKLSTNTEIIYSLPQKPSMNPKVGKMIEICSKRKSAWFCRKIIKKLRYGLVLLKTLQTIVATSSECERSGIVWKRLNTYLWTLMVQNHFSALRLMHINLDVDNNAKRALKLFCKRERELQFTNICASKYNII